MINVPYFKENFDELFLRFTGAAGKYSHVQNDPCCTRNRKQIPEISHLSPLAQSSSELYTELVYHTF